VGDFVRHQFLEEGFYLFANAICRRLEPSTNFPPRAVVFNNSVSFSRASSRRRPDGSRRAEITLPKLRSELGGLRATATDDSIGRVFQSVSPAKKK
jgi:hypothetical protein